MKPLKSFPWPWALLHLLASAEAPGRHTDGACSFTLSVSGLDGPVGQLPDGRLSVGGTEPAATFRTDTRTGALVDVSGAGCAIADGTTRQLECRQEGSLYLEVTLDNQNQVLYRGSPEFYACTPPGEALGAYLSPESSNAGCVSVTVQASGCGGASESSGPGSAGPGRCAEGTSTLWETSTATELSTLTVTVTQGDTATCEETPFLDSEQPALEGRSVQEFKGTPPRSQPLAGRQVEGDNSWPPSPHVYEEQAYMDKWNSIPNKVTTGGYTKEPLEIDFGMSLAGGSSYYSGCTIIYVVTRKSIRIGHFPEINKNDKCPLHTETLTRREIFPWLDEFVLDVESPNDVPLECEDAWVLIGGTVGVNSGGVPLLREWFEENNFIPSANIKYWQYGGSSGAGEATNPQGTSMVEWTSTDDRSGTLGVYFSSTAPRLWLGFRTGDDGVVESSVSWGSGVRPRKR